MERTNEFDFYIMSRRINRLLDMPYQTSAGVSPNNWYEIYDAAGAFEDMLEGKPCPLGLSRSKASAALGQLNTILDRYVFQPDANGAREFRQFTDPAQTPNIPSWFIDQAKRAIRDWETIFAEEMREAATYRVPDRGIFSIPKLVDFADEAFPKTLHGFIAEKTLVDWKAAGRCLAFNLVSASGFHVARAVEGTLERYYQAFCNKTNTLKSMNDYIVHLEKITGDNAPDAKVVAELRQFKDDHRNPLMHPRVVLSETDARMLFAKGEGIVMGMAQDLQQLAIKKEIAAKEAPADAAAP